MPTIRIKTFMLQKEGDPIFCEDAMAIDIAKLRFAVADGVSQSVNPIATAQKACQLYMDCDIEGDNWESQIDSYFLPALAQHWTHEEEKLESQLSRIDLRDTKGRRKLLPVGSTTLAGVNICPDCGRVKYHILGDSTVFVKSGTEPIKAICSNLSDDKVPGQHIDYDNRPSCFTSRSRNCVDAIEMTTIGHWALGDFPLAEGWIALMTDGAAAWFQHSYENGQDPFEKLWQLRDQTHFTDFAIEQRNQGLMNDDLAIILIRIQPGEDQIEVLYRGDLIFRGEEVVSEEPIIKKLIADESGTEESEKDESKEEDVLTEGSIEVQEKEIEEAEEKLPPPFNPDDFKSSNEDNKCIFLRIINKIKGWISHLIK